ncbi:hypothetical protein LTR49_024827 [Elasticomyces elasticus]|nr:hypothetical protein LTR49_024827 [Elasticomyces elasticus]
MASHTAEQHDLAEPLMLEKIDQLFACGAGELVGSILRKEHGLCTRFATQIVLRRAVREQILVSIIPARDASTEHCQRVKKWGRTLPALDHDTVKEIMDEVHEEMGLSSSDRVDGKRAPTFSLDVLRLENCGPDQEHLNVIDVPGIFKSTTEGVGVRTKADIQLVRNMVKGYMDNPRSVMLAVLPTSVDLATQEILELARSWTGRFAHTCASGKDDEHATTPRWSDDAPTGGTEALISPALPITTPGTASPTAPSFPLSLPAALDAPAEGKLESQEDSSVVRPASGTDDEPSGTTITAESMSPDAVATEFVSLDMASTTSNFASTGETSLGITTSLSATSQSGVNPSLELLFDSPIALAELRKALLSPPLEGIGTRVSPKEAHVSEQTRPRHEALLNVESNVGSSDAGSGDETSSPLLRRRVAV